VGQLNARRVATAKAGKHHDGGGLMLLVSPKGSKRWVYRYQIRGRRRDMGIGSCPPVLLAEARERAADARAMVRRGIDPLEGRKTPPTFATAAASYIRAHRRDWSPRWARQWASGLRQHAGGLRAMPVDAIGTEHVLRALQPLWGRAPRTGRRVRQKIETVLDAAAARGWRSGENPARWRGHLEHLLSRPAPSVPFEMVDWREIPKLYAELPETVAGNAVRFAILTAARAGEVRFATREEIDGDWWSLAAGRTKQRRRHEVPLSPQALALLARLPNTGPLLFEGRTEGRPIGPGALRHALATAGYPIPAHGLRATFRTWAGEVSGAPYDVIEMSLGHAVGTGLERRYNRAELRDRRRALLERWADFCTGSRTVQVVDRIRRFG
jgi:integrase